MKCLVYWACNRYIAMILIWVILIKLTKQKLFNLTYRLPCHFILQNQNTISWVLLKRTDRDLAWVIPYIINKTSLIKTWFYYFYVNIKVHKLALQLQNSSHLFKTWKEEEEKKRKKDVSSPVTLLLKTIYSTIKLLYKFNNCCHVFHFVNIY